MILTLKLEKFPVFSLLNREFGREEFARDCTHRQTVSPFFLRPGLTPLCPAIAGISRIQPDTFIFSGAAFLASCPNTRSNLEFLFEWDIYQILKDLNFQTIQLLWSAARKYLISVTIIYSPWTEKKVEDFWEKYSGYFYFVFRLFVGLLFFQHGAQKLLGWFTNKPPVELFSLMGQAGVIEFAGGLAIALGLFTRLGALAGGIEMMVAYFMVHVPRGPIPIVNKGELALLFFAAFLILMVHGAKKWGLEKFLFKKEFF